MVPLPETIPRTVPKLVFFVIYTKESVIKTVNIKDVAKEAGVAVSTVSRVLNNHSDVKKETKEHVLEVIKRLNYVPNNSARNLKRNNSNAIGIFVLGEYNPFFGDIVESLESEISSKGYSVMIHFHHAERDALESAAQFIIEKKLLGLIYLGGAVSKDKEGYFEGLEAPVVFTSTIIEEGVNRDLFSSVSINEEDGVKEVTNYLIGLGHTKIGIIIAERMGLCVSPKDLLLLKMF
ncbi:LacI family transcriptional regulator [Thiospirochaeta perfilievii]|uniref:LacI family transcriptional regulator n=1 Tax=Thiospirochaeta perfilievii TaxID=252967 RepID=A0A5C1QAC7_9SPIO|nr:LacI family transcriptional regulator [Thiospirochaeta perfilievii]